MTNERLHAAGYRLVDTHPAAARRPRDARPRVMSRCVRCTIATAQTSKADVWSKRRLIVIELTCEHQIRKFSRRRYLIGELVRCRVCEVAVDGAVARFEW